MSTIKKLYDSMGKCPCCAGEPELKVDGMCPTEIFVKCKACGLSTRRRRAASIIYPQKGMEGTNTQRLDASERRQKIRLSFRAIADWNRRPNSEHVSRVAGARPCMGSTFRLTIHQKP